MALIIWKQEKSCTILRRELWYPGIQAEWEIPKRKTMGMEIESLALMHQKTLPL